MRPSEINAGDTYLWKVGKLTHRIRVKEIKEDGVYFTKNIGEADHAPFNEIHEVHTQFQYLQYPISKQ